MRDLDPTPDERAQHEKEQALAALRDLPGWGIFRERLLDRISEQFELFLDASDAKDMTRCQGESAAYLRCLQEVDHASTRAELVYARVRATYEASIEKERALRRLEAEQALRRGRTSTPI